MSGLQDLDWNADLDEITSEQNTRTYPRSQSCYSLGESDSALEWNFDLDDVIDNKDNIEFRRHSAPCSLPSRKKANAVRFGSVQVRECERTLGDNPACEDGPSLSIGWRHNTLKPIKLDTFEAIRHNKRRSKKELRTPKDERISLLVRAGFAKKDIERNMQLISYFHEERNETLMSLHMEKSSQYSLADKVRPETPVDSHVVYC